jgi:hypothetical protein
MTARAIGFALMRRETDRARIVTMMIALAAVGGAAGHAASRIPVGTTGSVAILLRFDRTIAALFAIAAVFRVIEHIRTDAASDWMLQLTAAGAPRDLYVLILAACVTVALAALYTFGGLCFAISNAAFGGGLTPLIRVVSSVPLCALLILSGSTFGAALAMLLPAAAAVHAALALIAAPWLALWLEITLRDAPAGGGILRFLDYPPPRLFVAATLSHVSYVLVYTAVTGGIALFLAHRRIGRRT